MANERSVVLHGKWLEAATKFDYFVLGVSLALVGYLGQALEPGPLGFDSGTIELSAVISLLASTYLGFRRIEAAIDALRLNTRLLEHGERAGKLKHAASTGVVGINVQSGEILPPSLAFERAAASEVLRPKIRTLLEESKDRAGSSYRWRNRFLILGLILLVAARVLEAYMTMT